MIGDQNKEVMQMPMIGNTRNPMRNDAGYLDPTACKAIKEADKDNEKANKLLHTIFSICDLSGFRIDNRIILVDKNTGKTWK